jgi:hypothetical protein
MGDTRKSRDWKAAASRAASITASVLIFGGIAAGIVLGVPVLQDRLAQRTHASAVRVDFEWPKLAATEQPPQQTRPPADAAPITTQTWVPTSIQDELMAVAHTAVESASDPFSQKGLRRVAEDLEKSGWFESIDAVTRRRDRDGVACIHITATWRIPAAVVRMGDHDFLVSWKGGSPKVVLLNAQQQPELTAGMPTHGQTWPGVDVRAALELLAVIESRPWAAQIRAIDLSQYFAKRQLALVTTRNSRIIWGGGPSDTIPGEVASDIKLARIEALAARFEGRIDAGHRLVEVFGPITTVDNSASADPIPAPTPAPTSGKKTNVAQVPQPR